MRDFRRLQVWQRAHQLTLAVYRMTESFPKHELYGLTSQLRRSAMSIPTNMAEGCGRESIVELARFLQIAMGSAKELEYQLLLAHDLGYVQPDVYCSLNDETRQVQRMLHAYLGQLRGKNKE
ncbi:MAG: four helix bundle protein [Chloroflexi bacterium]|nr:four helix bundle protein [Chloroflexota bacterium]